VGKQENSFFQFLRQLGAKTSFYEVFGAIIGLAQKKFGWSYQFYPALESCFLFFKL